MRLDSHNKQLVVRCALAWGGISDDVMIISEAQVGRLWTGVDVVEWLRGRVKSLLTPSHVIVRNTI